MELRLKKSPIGLILSILGKKWTFEILDSLIQEELHFSDILKQYPDLSGKMLSRRVKELFELGLIGKTISSLQPLEFKYHISQRGSLLRPLFYEMGVTSTRIFRNEVLEDANKDTSAIKLYFGDLYLEKVE